MRIVSAVAPFWVVLSGPVFAQEEYLGAEREHWSLLPRTRPPVPEIAEQPETAWIATPIDAFVLRKLQAEGLKPAPAAGRASLIRRLTYDLTGLPPTPEEVAAFLADDSADAYGRLVDRLLSSPHYGERRAQHWLDVVRYAETEGFEYDRYLPGLWRYRDYVIRAFNQDKPYDRFVLEQLAGDELATVDAGDEGERQTLLVAAGFHRLGPVRRNAGNAEVAFSRNEVLTQQTDIIGAAFLGLTVGCARCHDHMFDPIRQTDYYRMQAFLGGTFEENVSLAESEQQSKWKRQTEKIEKQIAALKEKTQTAEGSALEELGQEIAAAEARLPAPLPTIATVAIKPQQRTTIHLLQRGDEQNKGVQLGMRVPGVLLPEGTAELPPDTAQPKTRLARWIIDPANPLTARVLANRVWLYHFGQGLVRTPNDFGVNGDEPSHPELLDYLASELVDGGWRLKPLHRLIVMSSTYRQASRSPEQQRAERVDPLNRLLWRYDRRRLSAEELRDSMLAVSGRLNLQQGGPSVVVPVEQELVDLLYKPSQWTVTEDARQQDRRSVYLLAKRNLRVPFMEVFDQPGLQTSCPLRPQSTHAPQALELLNGETSNRLASALAERLKQEAGSDPRQQVELAYQLIAARSPNQRELGLATEFLRTGSLREFALAMFNVNAFLYVD